MIKVRAKSARTVLNRGRFMKIILDGMGGDNAPEAVVDGAIDAARFLAGKEPGMYDMDDLLAE